MKGERVDAGGIPAGCAEVREALFAWLDHEVPPNDAARIARHVRQCPGCGRAAAHDRSLLAALRRAAGANERAGPELRARIARSLDDAARASAD
jgi:anti-sigma factor (TIGR02949 family)